LGSNLIKAGEFPLTLSQISQQNMPALCFKKRVLEEATQSPKREKNFIWQHL
jgi:hypothetical protein